MEPIVARGIEFDEDGARTPLKRRVFYRIQALFAFVIALAVAANGGYLGPLAQWGLILGALVMAEGGLVTARSRVDIYDDEVRIVNGFRVHQIPRAQWGEFRQERRFGIETGFFQTADGRPLKCSALHPGGYSFYDESGAARALHRVIYHLNRSLQRRTSDRGTSPGSTRGRQDVVPSPTLEDRDEP